MLLAEIESTPARKCYDVHREGFDLASQIYTQMSETRHALRETQTEHHRLALSQSSTFVPKEGTIVIVSALTLHRL